MVSQTGVAVGQSEFWLHGSPMQAPTPPVVFVQYSLVAQLFAPASVSRHPTVQTPDATEVVSQYESAAQSES